MLHTPASELHPAQPHAKQLISGTWLHVHPLAIQPFDVECAPLMPTCYSRLLSPSACRPVSQDLRARRGQQAARREGRQGRRGGRQVRAAAAGSRQQGAVTMSTYLVSSACVGEVHPVCGSVQAIRLAAFFSMTGLVSPTHFMILSPLVFYSDAHCFLLPVAADALENAMQSFEGVLLTSAGHVWWCSASRRLARFRA